jgi:hypothetical protein
MAPQVPWTPLVQLGVQIGAPHFRQDPTATLTAYSQRVLQIVIQALMQQPEEASHPMVDGLHRQG